MFICFEHPFTDFTRVKRNVYKRMAIKHGLNLCLRDFIHIFWLDLVLDEEKTKREAIFVDTGRGNSLISSNSAILHNLTNIYFNNNTTGCSKSRRICHCENRL